MSLSSNLEIGANFIAKSLAIPNKDEMTTELCVMKGTRGLLLLHFFF